MKSDRKMTSLKVTNEITIVTVRKRMVGEVVAVATVVMIDEVVRRIDLSNIRTSVQEISTFRKTIDQKMQKETRRTRGKRGRAIKALIRTADVVEDAPILRKLVLMPGNRKKIVRPNPEIHKQEAMTVILINPQRNRQNQMRRDALTVAVDAVRQEVTMNKLWLALD